MNSHLGDMNSLGLLDAKPALTPDYVIAELAEASDRIRQTEIRLEAEREHRDELVVTLITVYKLSWRVVAAYAGVSNPYISTILKKRGVLI